MTSTHSKRIVIEPVTRVEGHGKVSILLDEEHLGSLSGINPPDLDYPQSFWNDYVRRDLIFGERVDDFQSG